MKQTVIAEGILEREVLAAPTAIVSDLHMNGAGGQDNFQPALFREWLDSVPADWRVIVNGDFVDLWECPSISRIWANNARLLTRLSARPGQNVLGNHDEDLPRYERELVGIGGRTIVRYIDGPDLRLEHGHRLDPACSGPLSWIGRAATAVWAAIERVGLGSLLEGLKDRACAWSKRRLETSARRGDGNLAYEYEADRFDRVLYVTGHTHKPALAERTPGRFYANPGSWVEPGKGYAIEIEGRAIRLVEVST